MQILARQNIFQVHKAPISTRENRFVESVLTSRQFQNHKGINTSRQYSIDYDQLYNPYRLKQLGSFDGHTSNSYKSMETKEINFSVCNRLRIINLGQKLLQSEIHSAENSQSIVNNYFKLGQILNEDHEKITFNQNIFSSTQSSILSFEIKDEMFGNIQKITSRDESFVSIPSQIDALTIFYSVISKNER